MSESATTADSPACPNCAALQQRIAELEARLAKLEKNSTNSSKPPSSDFVSPKAAAAKKRKKRRKPGGQSGHPKHERTAFQASELDHTWDYAYERCPDCDGQVTLLDQPSRVVQQIEMAPQPVVISEHRGRSCYCAKCQKSFAAPLPPEVRKAGLVSPELTALIADLKGACHCSYSTIRKYLHDVLGATISCGQLRRVCAKVTHSLDSAYDELQVALRSQKSPNVDETGHPENGRRLWTWCFRAPLFTLFKIDPSRGSDVLLATLGTEFDGVLGCDYFSAYRKYMRLNTNVVVQFCLAHLIRDVKFLAEHPAAKNRTYGCRLQEALRNLFGVIHRRERYASEATFRAALTRRGDEVRRAAAYRVPAPREAQALARRFVKHGVQYLQFVVTPGIEPTNNVAEQAIRFVVIDRRITQGSRSEAGRRWLERIWTTIATCTQHGKSVLAFLTESVKTFLSGTPSPTRLFSSA